MPKYLLVSEAALDAALAAGTFAPDSMLPKRKAAYIGSLSAIT
jgi:hypothetical protein